MAAQNHRIQLAWNGPASLPGAVNARVNVGRVYGTASHLESGGSITISAAAGFRPAFANTVHINGQGIIVQGVGFTRSTASGELPSATAGVLLINGASQPLEPVVHFQDCYFGNAAGLGTMRDFASAGVPFPDNAVLANGIVTQGLSRSLSFTGCRFWGTLNAAKLVTRRLRIEDSDFAAMAMDAIDIFGHTFTSGYTAAAWITRCTFRDCIDTWENRNQHVDGIQYCAPMDIHQGTRLLVTDCSMHLAHSFAGDPGMGGGSQGMHGGNNPTLDNQFVVRRTTIMSTAPNTFTYYSPRASRPSFVDQCTFFRAGRTPSAFAPDRQPQQDYLVGITGSASYFPASGDWLLVTNTIASDLYAGEGAITETIPVDPRPTAAPQLRPESVFNGRDFARGSASVNGLPQKFGYDLPNERRSQAAFVADMWANFSPASAHAGRGAPDPRSIAWRA